MAEPTTTRYQDIFVKLSLGGSPETFAEPCGFTSKSITLDAALAETIFGDCSDPTIIPSITRDKVSKSFTISGEGVIAAESVAVWVAAWNNPNPVNCLVQVEVGSVTMTVTGAIHVSSLNPSSGITDGRATMAVEASSSGTFTVAVA